MAGAASPWAGRSTPSVCLSVRNTPAEPRTTLQGSAHTHSGSQSEGRNGGEKKSGGGAESPGGSPSGTRCWL